MNYGLLLSGELQKQGARAISAQNVIKELLRRKDFTAIEKGVNPYALKNLNISEKLRPTGPSRFSNNSLTNPKLLYGTVDPADIRLVRSMKNEIKGNTSGFVTDIRPKLAGNEAQYRMRNMAQDANDIKNRLKNGNMGYYKYERVAQQRLAEIEREMSQFTGRSTL